MSHEVTLPVLGESVSEGTVSRWLKKVGDSVALDEPLVEISTDKVDTEIPSPVAGVLTEIRVQEDETVAVGAVLAVVGEPAPAISFAPITPVAAPVPPTPAPTAPTPVSPVASSPAPVSALPQIPESTTPSAPDFTSQVAAPVLSPNRWPPTSSMFQPPIPVTPPTPPPTFQPATPAPFEPFIPPPSLSRESSTGPEGLAITPSPYVPPVSPHEVPEAIGTSVYVTPLVRKLADEKGVDLATVTGSGVGGRIRKQDILDAAQSMTANTPAPTEVSFDPIEFVPPQVAPEPVIPDFVLPPIPVRTPEPVVPQYVAPEPAQYVAPEPTPQYVPPEPVSPYYMAPEPVPVVQIPEPVPVEEPVAVAPPAPVEEFVSPFEEPTTQVVEDLVSPIEEPAPVVPVSSFEEPTTPVAEEPVSPFEEPTSVVEEPAPVVEEPISPFIEEPLVVAVVPESSEPDVVTPEAKVEETPVPKAEETLKVEETPVPEVEEPPVPKAEETPVPKADKERKKSDAKRDEGFTPEALAEMPSAGTTEKISRLRATIAKRMVDSLHTSAQLTATVEVDLTLVSRLRTQVKDDFKAREGVSLTFLPFIAKAAMEALKAYPKVNATIDMEAGVITYPHETHLAIAVDTPKGLLVPVIKSAGDLSVSGLAKKIADISARTRNNQITPDDLQGGTFTITNYGSAGTLFDTPIVNQPQVAILGTGTIKRRPVVVDDSRLGEIIAIRDMMYLSLSYDHRLVDGADAARFLVMVKERLEAGDFGAEF